MTLTNNSKIKFGFVLWGPHGPIPNGIPVEFTYNLFNEYGGNFDLFEKNFYNINGEQISVFKSDLLKSNDVEIQKMYHITDRFVYPVELVNDIKNGLGINSNIYSEKSFFKYISEHSISFFNRGKGILLINLLNVPLFENEFKSIFTAIHDGLKYRNILANGVVILYDKKVLNLVSEYDLFCGDNNIDGDDKIIFFDGGDDIIQDLRSIVYER
jgi:hypothetical protein